MPDRRPTRHTRHLWGLVVGLASGAAVQAALPAASAQKYELVPPFENAVPRVSPETAISVRAQIDVVYTPPGASAPILVQRAIETSASAVNLSSQYIFDVLNEAAIAGVEQALAGGAQTGRISVVAVCYMFGSDNNAKPVLSPMGVYINTTDLNVLPNGNAALQSKYKVIPPGR